MSTLRDVINANNRAQEAEQRATDAETRINAALDLHDWEAGVLDPNGSYCAHCHDNWPCPTRRALLGITDNDGDAA